MDLLIGHPKPTGGGTVYIRHGQRDFGTLYDSLRFAGTIPDSFGCSIAVGRADGTGVRNLLVGACGDESGGAGAGAARLYSIGSVLQPVPLRT
ncbi:MAG: hypothetical protein ABIS67_07775, partial [Candidatus Eisenbacteria bacterium]